jgi:hypothetical protein
MLNDQPARRSTPELFIEPGWPLSSLRTTEQCDKARDTLVTAIAKMRARFAVQKNAMAGGGFDEERAFRARQALRFKKQALQRTTEIRAKLARSEKIEGQDRRILDILRAMVPEAFAAAIKEARERYPEIEWRT